jgi:fatty acid-binding protein DegV
LKYLQRSGRVSQIKATLGSLLQIKPVIQMHQSKIEMSAARTVNGSIERLLKILKSLGPLDKLELVHAHAPERAARLAEAASAYFPVRNIQYSVDITPVLGSHLGPGVFGFVAVQK